MMDEDGWMNGWPDGYGFCIGSILDEDVIDF
jgi:hypothetical protein